MTQTIAVACIGKAKALEQLLTQHLIQGASFKVVDVGEAHVILTDKVEPKASVPFVVLGGENLLAKQGYALAMPCSLHVLIPLLLQLASAEITEEALKVGSWQLFIKQQLLVKGKKEVNLTDKEVQLIQCLQEALPEAVSKEKLLGDIWGYSPEIETHTLETHMYRLRQKVGENFIEKSDKGYCLV